MAIEKTKTHMKTTRFCDACEEEIEVCCKCNADLENYKFIGCDDACEHYCPECTEKYEQT